MTDDELERRLRLHYRDLDPGATPPGLATRVDARLAAKASRSSVPVRTRAALGAVIAAIAVIAVGLLFGPGGLLVAASPTSVPPSPTPVVSASPSTTSSSPNGSGGAIVPWKPLPAAAPTPAAAPAVRACGAGDLVSSGLTFGGFATGTEGFGGTLRLAAGASPCALAADLPAKLEAANGSTIAPTALRATDGTSAVIVAAGAPADLSLAISGWCTARTPATVVLGLAGGGTLRLDVAGAQTGRACVGPTTYDLSATASSASAPMSTPAIGYLSLAVSVEATSSPVAGQPFAYDVTLTNPTLSTVDFTTCPAYVEGFKIDGATPQRYQLDCAAAAPIPAGGSETFAMVIAVPSDAPSGPTTLSWGIVGSVNDGNAELNIAPNPSVAPTTARPCGPGDIAAGPVWWTGAGGAMGGGVTFTDTAASPCALDGWADISILDAKGAVMPITVRHATGASPAPVVLLPGLGTPDPNGPPMPGRAGVQIVWMNWCGTQPFPPGTLVVTVPSVGRLTAPISGLSVARCDTPGSPSTLEASPIVSATP